MVAQSGALQAHIAQFKASSGKGGEQGDYVNLFSHIVKCFHCDASVIRWNKGKKHGRHVLVCDSGFRGNSKCGVKPWKMDEFEEKVLKCVREIDLSSVLGSECSERVAALEMQLTALQGKLLNTDVRLSRLVLALEQGADASPVVVRIRELQAESESLREEQLLAENHYQVAREALDTAETKQKELIALTTVIHDRDVRTKLKQQLRGLIERIDVDLVKKQMVVFYIGQRPRMRPISPDVSPKMFKLIG